jgi:hypothetical protein
VKQRSLILLFLLLTLSTPAKDGGLLQTGSVSVSKLDNGSGDFRITSRSVAMNSFDKHGNPTKTITLRDFNEDGIPDEASTNTLIYDRRGELLSSHEEFDTGADDVVYRRSIVIYTNFGGNPRPWIVLVANNADGTIDEILTHTYSFDTDGRLIGVTTEIDTNADGISDFHSLESWTYNPAGNLVWYTNRSDIYNAGTLETVAFEHDALNERGDPESASWSRYEPNVGGWLSGTLAFTYDKFGNLLQEVNGTLLPGPVGTSLSTTTTTFFYAHRGRVTSLSTLSMPLPEETYACAR